MKNGHIELTGPEGRVYQAVLDGTDGGKKILMGTANPGISGGAYVRCMERLTLLGIIDQRPVRPGSRTLGRRIVLLRTLDGQEIPTPPEPVPPEPKPAARPPLKKLKLPPPTDTRKCPTNLPEAIKLIGLLVAENETLRSIAGRASAALAMREEPIDCAVRKLRSAGNSLSRTPDGERWIMNNAPARRLTDADVIKKAEGISI